eukprot:contig_10930_g2601
MPSAPSQTYNQSPTSGDTLNHHRSSREKKDEDAIRAPLPAGCLLLLRRLRLCLPPHRLHPVLALLPLLAGARRGRSQALANQPILGLKLLRIVQRVVDDSKAGGLAATKGNAKAKHKDGLRVRHLVHLRQLILQLRLGDGPPAGMQHINDLRRRNQIGRTHQSQEDGSGRGGAKRRDVEGMVTTTYKLLAEEQTVGQELARANGA